MARLFKSGAFIQQCFATHPLCLGFKKFTSPDLMVLQCSSCRFRHGVRVRGMTSRPSASINVPAQQPAEDRAEEHLAHCANEHPTALRVSGLEVTEDALDLRCGECRRTFAVEAAAFETHAP